MSNTAIDTAARFGEIPFVEFTKELVTGVFDALVEAHILQMEEFAAFTSSLTDDLSTYINNTRDGVSFDDISEFILAYELPEADVAEIGDALALLEAPSQNDVDKPFGDEQPATTSTWWGGLINALAPAVNGLVDKIDDPSEQLQYTALLDYNEAVLAGAEITADKIPSYQEIRNSIAALIASNKYGLLQNMAKQGMMRLVVTEGEIETKITFSTWNTSSRGREATYKKRNRVAQKTKDKKTRGIFGIFGSKKSKQKTRSRVVTVNTAKSYQRDSSGTKVDIFGRVLIRFKTDYAPLNG